MPATSCTRLSYPPAHRPGPGAAVGAQLDHDHARRAGGELLRPVAEGVERTEPDRVEHHVGVGEQLVERVAIPRVAQVQEGGALAKPGVDDQRCDLSGRSAAVTASTSAPWAASTRPHTGPAMTRDRSSTRTPVSGFGPAPRRASTVTRRGDGHGHTSAAPMRSRSSTGHASPVRRALGMGDPRRLVTQGGGGAAGVDHRRIPTSSAGRAAMASANAPRHAGTSRARQAASAWWAKLAWIFTQPPSPRG